jgi:7-keto-8-aminopelargonate synthetase-like enzyme
MLCAHTHVLRREVDFSSNDYLGFSQSESFLLPLMILVCHKMLQKTAQRIQDNLEITSLQDDRFHSRFINPKLP